VRFRFRLSVVLLAVIAKAVSRRAVEQAAW
jgi:hypothetical protein